ncbi:unnamed protein product [Caenorhabditis brenneri]
MSDGELVNDEVKLSFPTDQPSYPQSWGAERLRYAGRGQLSDLIFDEGKWMVDEFGTHLQDVVQKALDRGVSSRFNGFKPKAFEDMDWFEGIGFKVFTGFFDRESKEFEVSGKMPNKVSLYLDEDMIGKKDP